MIFVLLLITLLSSSCDRQLSRYDAVRVQTDFDYAKGITLTVNAGADLVTNVPVLHSATVEGKVDTAAWEQVGGANEVEFSAPSQLSTQISATRDGTYTLRFTALSVRGETVSDEVQFVWDTTAPSSPLVLGASSLTPGGESSRYVNSTTPYLDWDDAIDVGSGVNYYNLTWYRQAECLGVANTVNGLTASHYQVTGAEGDVFSYQVVSVDKLGHSTTSSCAPSIVIDLTPPPPLTAFSGATGRTVGTVDLTVTYPADVSDYGQIVLRRLVGGTAPTSCTAGDKGATVTSGFAGVQVVADDSEEPGGNFSYLACVFDKAGNATASHTTVNKISKRHLIFATAATYDGSIQGGGITQADSLCQTAGSAVTSVATLKQEAKWRSLLSTSAISAATRVNINGAVESNGTIVALSRAAFWGGTLQASVFETETGAAAPAFAWTGTTSAGAAASTTCSDWTTSSGAVQGKQGDTNATTSSWVAQGDAACSATKALYCVSQYNVAALSAFTGQAGSGASGKIDLSLTLPTSRSRYYQVKLQRLAGSTAPTYDCSTGTTVKTFTLEDKDTVLTYADTAATPAAGSFSYRACVLDKTGATVTGSSITSITSSP